MSTNGHTAQPADQGLDRAVLVIAGVVILGVIMSIFDTTIVNVALETLSRDLNAPLNTIQWVSTGYLLALAVMIPLTGWASERYGSKQVWMLSVLLFGLGSALCGLAWSAGSLIFFRVLQGIGGGMILPVGMSVLTQTAGPHRIGRVMSVVGVPMLLGPILGPVIGGLIVDNASWRWIFYVNIPIVILALVLAARILPKDAGRADAGKLDWRGLLLLSPGAGLIVFGLSETQSHGGFAAPIVWVPALVGVSLVIAFVRHAMRVERPLIDMRLFRNPAFSAASFTTFMLGGALFGAMIILPLYYQVARGESALTAGLLMAPQGLGAAMAMPLAGRLTDRIGGGRVALFGLVVMTAGTVPFAFLGASTPYPWLAGMLVVRGLGLGATMMPSMAAAYASLSREAIPRATSAINVIRQVGGSLGTAVLAVALQHQIATRLPAGRGAGNGTVAQLPESIRHRVAVPLADAFAHTFWYAIAMSVLAIPAAILLARSTSRGPAVEQFDPAEEPAFEHV
jgi:EmrB/QacA subfamily drug resistance transporter